MSQKLTPVQRDALMRELSAELVEVLTEDRSQTVPCYRVSVGFSYALSTEASLEPRCYEAMFERIEKDLNALRIALYKSCHAMLCENAAPVDSSSQEVS